MIETKEIARYGKYLHEKDLVIGTGGNISVRDGDFIIIKKKGKNMSLGKDEDYVCLPFPEAEKDTEVTSSETPVHIETYKSNDKIAAIIHVHSPFVIAVAGKTKCLKSTSYEFDCVLNKEVPVLKYIRPGSLSLAMAVAKEISSGANAVMLERHGAFSVGKDLEEAYIRILALERACTTFLHM